MPEHAESNKPPGPASPIRKFHNVADVVIASGGPNGLMRACELGLAGIRPVLPDQSPGPNTQRRAAGIVGQGVRIFDRRGLYAGLAEKQSPRSRRPAQFLRALDSISRKCAVISSIRCASNSPGSLKYLSPRP